MEMIEEERAMVGKQMTNGRYETKLQQISEESQSSWNQVYQMPSAFIVYSLSL